MPKIKVVAYITRGRELLVFEHADDAEAGVQVPAGTVEPGEEIEAAVWREVAEETGLNRDQLEWQGWLAVMPHPTFDLVRHYAWLTANGDVPDTWRHHVLGDGEDRGLMFEYRWEPWDLVELAGHQDECLGLISL